jgi:hypothetical protein
MTNGAFAKWLVNEEPVVVSVHSVPSGGEARFTSTWRRHVNGVPAWLTCVVWAGVAVVSPLTPSQPPYRLSKL